VILERDLLHVRDRPIADVAWPEPLDDVRIDVEKSGAPDAQQPLVAGADDEIGVPAGRVEAALARRLDGIDQGKRPMFVGGRTGPLDVELGAVDPGDGVETEQVGPLERLVKPLEVQPATRCRHLTYLDTLLLESRPGEDAGGVFEVGPDHTVTGRPFERVGDPGDAIGRRPTE